VATCSVALEAIMGSKDKRGDKTKKAPAKGLKEKRLDKKAKKSGHTAGSNQSMDKTFGH
jgi:hypothetical protein